MNVADFMQNGTDTPLYIQAPWGLARVIGVIARQPRPQVIALSNQGPVFLWALWTTPLEQFDCGTCLDTGEVDCADSPFGYAGCPECQRVPEVPQYP